MKRLKAAWKLVFDSVQLFLSRNAFQSAGALAFSTLFSMAPLLIVAISVAGIVLGDEAVQGQVAVQLSDFIGKDAAGVVQEAVRRSRIEVSGIWPTLLGIAALIFGATTVFAQLRSSLNSMWEVRPQPARNDIVNFLMTRLLSFGMVVTIGFLLLMSFLLSIALSALVQFANGLLPVPAVLVTIADKAVSLLIVTLLFGLIFRVLPDVHLSWKNVARSALITGVLFIIGQSLISLYLTRAGPASTYGAAGSLVIVLMWVYYSSIILLLGAAITRVLLQHERGNIRPSRGAVRIETVVVEEPS